MKNLMDKIGKALLLISIISSFEPAKTITSEIKYKDTRKVIILDPGHGMDNKGNWPLSKEWKFDEGATYKKYRETDIVLEQAKTIKNMLDSTKYKVILTREDNFIPTPLRFRPYFANQNNADLFISLHTNNFELRRIKGSEVFYRENKNRGLAKLAAKNLEKFTPIENRQVKKRNYIVLDSINCPAILIEPGYLSNSRDRKYLTDTIPDIEKAIAKTIKDYFSNN